MAKRQEKHNEILENPEALKEKLVVAETWVEKHSKLMIGVSVALLLIVGGYFGFQYYKDSQNLEAQKEMFQAVYYFEADSLEKALNGDANNVGFLTIIDEYGMTEAANLANFYTGAIYLKQGKYDLARTHLEKFSSNDLLVQARAYSLIGDTYTEEQKFEDAAGFYDKAANYKPNKFFSPAYMMKGALAYEKANKKDKAIEIYDQIISKYWNSAEYQKAKKYRARLNPNF